MNKQTFQIPEGCKAITMEQIGNQLVTTFEVEPIRWRAEDGQKYYCFDWEMNIAICTETGHNADNIRYNSGNYFQSKEQALRAAKRIEQALDDFWKEELK